MKLTVLGAGGVRTPLIVRSLIARQDRLGLDELALMDIDAERLDLMAWLTAPLEQQNPLRFHINRTTDARAALDRADFVITTFRVGDMAGRALDERVALNHGALGQETTGPAGFAMGLRSIPVLRQYLDLMREVCPQAWLINFANPAGMLAEAATRGGHWARTVGICDAPTALARAAALFLQAPPDEVFLDYFGLNHLGWAKGVWRAGRNYLPDLIDLFVQVGVEVPGFPFSPSFIQTLGLLPNEYLYYYYSNEAVPNLIQAGRTRGEQLLELNTQLYADLRQARAAEDAEHMQAIFEAYHRRRGETYFVSETGGHGSHDLSRLSRAELEALAEAGYAGVAINVMEALLGRSDKIITLNVPNQGAIAGLREDDVVETPCWVGRDWIRPLAVGPIPEHCVGLMQQVKAYERLSIDAALEHSYAKALKALSLHPLTPNPAAAQAMLNEYIARHGVQFPVAQP